MKYMNKIQNNIDECININLTDLQALINATARQAADEAVKA